MYVCMYLSDNVHIYIIYSWIYVIIYNMYLFIRYDNLSIVYDYVFMIGYYMVISKHDKCYINTGILELGDWKKEEIPYHAIATRECS